MKLATFTVDSSLGSTHRVGIKDGDHLLDLTAGYARVLAAEGRANPTEKARTLAPPAMKNMLENGDDAMDAARVVKEADFDADERAPSGARIRYSLDDDEIAVMSPVPSPNSVRDCIVFEEHLRNTLREDIPDIWYDMPVYYKSSTENIYGPGDTIHWPSYSDEADYELELAVVIGKEGRNIPADDANEFIAGYTIFNDFSARDIQMEEMELGLGPSKGKDFGNGFGPYLATAEEVDLSDTTMRASVNGEVWSEGNANTMYHSFERIIEHASMDETLYPGDVIGSGTVGGGCGLELDRRLEDRDTVTLEIEGIGTLQNTIRF